MNEEIILNQKKWLHNLTSGEYVKTTGDLVRIVGIDSGVQHKYCVMGVAGRVMGHSHNWMIEDGSENKIGKEFGLPDKAIAYLVCMNDGANLLRNVEDFGHKRMHVRYTREQRSFDFIARWLEIYFALERKRESQL